MRKVSRKIAIILAVVMVLAMMPAYTFAEEGPTEGATETAVATNAVVQIANNNGDGTYKLAITWEGEAASFEVADNSKEVIATTKEKACSVVVDAGSIVSYSITPCTSTGEKMTPAQTDAILALQLAVAVLGDGEIQVSWDAVDGVDSYKVYAYKDGSKADSTTVTENTATFTGLSTDAAYSFAVEIDGVLSEVSEAKEPLQAPVSVTGLTAHPGYESVVLDWDVNEDADGFAVYKSKSANGTFELIGTVTNKDINESNGKVTYRDEDGEEYVTGYYKVYAYNGKNIETASFSEPVSVSEQPVRHMTYNLKMKKKVTITSHEGSKTKLTLAKGAKVTAVKFHSGKYVFYNKGCTYYLTKARTKTPTANYTTAFNYDKYTAEDFINATGLTSKTGRLIWVSTYTQHLYFFNAAEDGSWKLTDDWEISTGKPSTPSPTGLTGEKMIWKKLKKHHGIKWWSPYSSMNSFHAKRKSWKLGKPASGGCVRNTVEEALYIYNNGVINTRVLMY